MITLEDIEQAQQEWGNALIQIGEAYQAGGDYVAEAEGAVDRLYDYAAGNVLFKPTLAKEIPFRDTRARALSYFVAENGACREDKGFALRPWSKVVFDNHNFISRDSTAIVMGRYTFTDTKGEETRVDYTFGYRRDETGCLRIVLHHSSLPPQ